MIRFHFVAEAVRQPQQGMISAPEDHTDRREAFLTLICRKNLFVDAGQEILRKPPIELAAGRIAFQILLASNVTSARLRFWILTMRFWTATRKH
jgi:hypothetical protein